MDDRMLARIAVLGLRCSLGTAFLSAVAGRLGWWGSLGGNWQQFLELTFGCLLIAGWQVRRAALGSAGLLTIFALAMASGDRWPLSI